ncbi:hypothetical protein ACROYT_G019221, partial [Oculina patagonica]
MRPGSKLPCLQRFFPKRLTALLYKTKAETSLTSSSDAVNLRVFRLNDVLQPPGSRTRAKTKNFSVLLSNAPFCSFQTLPPLTCDLTSQCSIQSYSTQINKKHAQRVEDMRVKWFLAFRRRLEN